MILIADSGSTKTDWALIQENGLVSRYQSDGLNPYFLSDQSIEEKISELPILEKISKIFFFGAGCASHENQKRLNKILGQFFKTKKVKVQSDILGAAIACSADQPALINILGTGSNSCYYTGKEVKKSMPSLGYILGDEGSGSDLGKRLLKARFQNKLPSSVNEAIDKRGALVDHLKNIYQKPFPNTYLASFAPIIFEFLDEKVIRKILDDSMRDFVLTQMLPYQEIKDIPCYFVGSIAHHGRKTLEETCKEYNFNFQGVLSKPIEALIEYYQK